MSTTRLHDDLLQDFSEQRKALSKQIELFDLLATALGKSAGRKLWKKELLVFMEILGYLLSAAMVAMTIALNLIFPFTQLKNVRFLKNLNEISQLSAQEYLSITIHAIFGFSAVLLLIIARMVRRIRLKNEILQISGCNIKSLVEYHLKRRAFMEAMEQRHFLELPGMETVENDSFSFKRN